MKLTDGILFILFGALGMIVDIAIAEIRGQPVIADFRTWLIVAALLTLISVVRDVADRIR